MPGRNFTRRAGSGGATGPIPASLRTLRPWFQSAWACGSSVTYPVTGRPAVPASWASQRALASSEHVAPRNSRTSDGSHAPDVHEPHPRADVRCQRREMMTGGAFCVRVRNLRRRPAHRPHNLRPCLVVQRQRVKASGQIEVAVDHDQRCRMQSRLGGHELGIRESRVRDPDDDQLRDLHASSLDPGGNPRDGRVIGGIAPVLESPVPLARSLVPVGAVVGAQEGGLEVAGKVAQQHAVDRPPDRQEQRVR